MADDAGEENHFSVFTNEQKLEFTGIPLLAQVLDAEKQVVTNDVDRRNPINEIFNVIITDFAGNQLYVTAEENAEIDMASLMGVDYSKRTWFYGHYLKSSDFANFEKYGLVEMLEYTLANYTKITYPRHIPFNVYNVYQTSNIRICQP